MKTVRITLKNVLIATMGMSTLALMLVVLNQNVIASLLLNSNNQYIQDYFTRDSFTGFDQPPDITVSSNVPSSVDNSEATQLIYSFRVMNNAIGTTENVVMRVRIPTSLRIVTVQAGCTRDGNDMLCTIPSMMPGGSRNFLISVSAPAGSLCGLTLTNEANVSTSTPESNTENNKLTAQTNFTCYTYTSSASSNSSVRISSRSNSSNVSVDIRSRASSSVTTSITDISAEMQTPEKINNDTAKDATYRVIVRNNTSVAASRTTTKIVIPHMLSVQSVPSGCIKNANEVLCTIESMGGNSEQEYKIEARTSAKNPCNQTVESVANVSTTTNEANRDNNRSGGTTYFECSITDAEKTDIAIAKTASASVSNDNTSTINYNITVTNKSEVTAKNIVIEDSIAPSLTLFPVPQGCTKSGNIVRCSIDTLERNASRSFTIGTSAPARTVCNQTIDNTASVSTATPETTTNNNKATARTTFTCSTPQTDISLPSGGNVQRMGNSFPITLLFGTTVTNESLVNADNVTISTEIPAPFVIGTLPTNCTKNNNTVTCSVGSLMFYSKKNISIPATAPARSMCDQTVTVSLSTSTTTTEKNYANNNTSLQFSFFCLVEEPTITMKSVAPTTIENSKESKYSYTVTVANTSNVTAYNVIADHAFIRYVPYVGTTQYRAIAELSPLVVTSLPSYCTQGAYPYNNKIQCEIGTLQPYESRTFIVEVSAPAQSVCRQRIVFTSTIKMTSPVRGDTYIQVANLTLPSCDETPSSMSTNSSTPTSSRANSVISRSSVASSSSTPVSSHSSAISSSSVRVSSRSISSIAVATTDLSIAMSAPITMDNNKVSDIKYSVTIRNISAVTAQNVIVSDVIPSSHTVLDRILPSGCTLNGQTVTCAIGTMTANTTRSFVIPVAIREKTVCNQTIMNQITVTSSTPDAYEGNNLAGAQTSFTCIVPRTDLEVTMSGPTSITKGYLPSQKFTYRVVVKNISSVTAENVTIQNTLSNKDTLGYTALPSQCTFRWSDYTITCSIPTLAPNASYILNVGVGTVIPFSCNKNVTNTASAVSQGLESNWMNNLARVQTLFYCP